MSRADILVTRLRQLRHAEDVGDDDTAADGSSLATEESKMAAPTATAITKPMAQEMVDDMPVQELLLALTDADTDDGHVENADAENGDFPELLPWPKVPTQLIHDPNEDYDDDDDDDGDNEQTIAYLYKSLGGMRSTAAEVQSARSRWGSTRGSNTASVDGNTIICDVVCVLEQAEDDAALEKQQTEGHQTGSDDSHAEHDDDNALGLPAVPTALADTVVDDDNDSDDAEIDHTRRDFYDGIAARLAALRGIYGTTAGLDQTDAFGLPSAPTFDPGSSKAAANVAVQRLRRLHFADSEQQTWCIVCFEDATVQCLGCRDNSNDSSTGHANNTYCTRCWRDLHVGPTAGFDARGHKRIPLVRSGTLT